jgi:hypothetical protein
LIARRPLTFNKVPARYLPLRAAVANNRRSAYAVGVIAAQQPTDDHDVEALDSPRSRISKRLAEIGAERAGLYARIEELNKEEFRYISAVLNDNENHAKFANDEYDRVRKLRSWLSLMTTALGAATIALAIFELVSRKPNSTEMQAFVALVTIAVTSIVTVLYVSLKRGFKLR